MKLADVRRFALGLREATEEPHHERASFRVRGKIFATFPPGAESLNVFVAESEREQALALYPGSVAKLHWGGKVVGLRIDLAAASPSVVKSLLQSAWERKAGR